MDKKPLPNISEETRKLYKKRMQHREQKNNMEKIKLLIRELLAEKFDKRVIGVFGDYTYPYGEQTGSDAIDYIAAAVAKNYPEHIVITGEYNYVYYLESDKLIKDIGLNAALNDEVRSGNISNNHYVRILASSCHFAIFLITRSRTTSILEEAEFLEDEFEDKIFGMGICIIDDNESDSKIDCGCFEVLRVNHKDDKYYFIFKKILKDETYCEGFFHPRKYGLTEPFITKHFTKLVATRYWKIIPNIFKGLNTRQSLQE